MWRRLFSVAFKIDFIVVGHSFRDEKFEINLPRSRGDRISRPLRCCLPHSVQVIHKKSNRGRRPNQRIKQKTREWQDGDLDNTRKCFCSKSSSRTSSASFVYDSLASTCCFAFDSKIFYSIFSFLLSTTTKSQDSADGGAPAVCPLMHSHSFKIEPEWKQNAFF